MADTTGVFVEEIPGGPPAITGLPTSNTAFLGTFARGPVNRALRVTSHAAFERTFGGLHPGSETSYAVHSFFQNGGAAAWIVRVTAGLGPEAPAPAAVALGDLALRATSPGAWGDRLRVGIAHSGGGTFFSLQVREYDAVLAHILREETFTDVSITKGDPRFVEDVVAGSDLIAARLEAATLPPRTRVGGSEAADEAALTGAGPGDLAPLTGGADGVTEGDPAWNTFARDALIGDAGDGTGMHALTAIAPEAVNLLCLPGAAVVPTRTIAAEIYWDAAAFCREARAFLLVDTPPGLDRTDMRTWLSELGAAAGPDAALYYPRLTGPDPLNPGAARVIGASGAVAAVIVRTDLDRGVWKAPAGTSATLSGWTPADLVDDNGQGPLNSAGVNVIRTFPTLGTVVWGARTLDGADARSSEWKYVNVRRTALYIEASLRRGLDWVVFEPNDEPLWASVRVTTGAFLDGLFRQGALAGTTARDAYFVRCDASTTTEADIERGIMNVLVGFAPTRPAEFVVIRIRKRFASAP